VFCSGRDRSHIGSAGIAIEYLDTWAIDREFGCISNRLALTGRWIKLPNAHFLWDSIQMCAGDM
jgi:hypothetical protein